MHDVMISYSSKNQSVVDVICNQLENNKISVWIAPRDLKNKTYPNGILEGIKNCKIIILVFSEYANLSNWVPREIERGVTYGKIIIPFKIEEVVNILPDFELCTCTSHWLNAINPPMEKNIELLIDTIKSILYNDAANTSGIINEKFNIKTPLGEISYLADRWAEKNYEYYTIEGLSKEARAVLRNPPSKIEIDDENLILFMLIASLHYGGNWNYWQKKVINNNSAVIRIFNVLEISYLRPKLRALYALQFYDKDTIRNAVFTTNSTVSPSLSELVEKYVYTKKVTEYFAQLVQNGTPQEKDKINVILMEIKRFSY